jgi:hypothetical protein
MYIETYLLLRSQLSQLAVEMIMGYMKLPYLEELKSSIDWSDDIKYTFFNKKYAGVTKYYINGIYHNFAVDLDLYKCSNCGLYLPELISSNDALIVYELKQKFLGASEEGYYVNSEKIIDHKHINCNFCKWQNVEKQNGHYEFVYKPNKKYHIPKNLRHIIKGKYVKRRLIKNT